jgi:Ca-activated chloride channel family protein
MKMLILLLVTTLNILENDISKINSLTKNAEKAFKRMDYKLAIKEYKTLIDSFNVSNEKIHLNLAHSYLLNKDTLKAIENYNMALITDDKIIKSISYQQLGNINESKNKLKEAAEFYKKSILSNNSNYDSKYNYELVTKKLKEEDKKDQDKKEEDKKDQDKKEEDKKDQDKKEEDKKDQDKKEEDKKDQDKKEEDKKDQDKKDQDKKDQDKKDQDKKDQDKKDQDKKEENKKEQKNKNQEKKEQEKSIEEKLKEINMSKKKAEMILNALNNIEFQYIQQLKRKASKKIDKSKPDW